MTYSILASLMILSGCANVELRDRNILAKSHMASIPDPLLESFTDHVYFSREGTSGGEGIGGGGCGCN